jgi:hypothetical protein
MALTGSNGATGEEKAVVDESTAVSVASVRRPYQKPRLRLLGSVRDLTFGSPVGGLNDGMGGRFPLM